MTGSSMGSPENGGMGTVSRGNDAKDFSRNLLRETAFHERIAPLCVARDMTAWAGFTVANVYRDVELEYSAIRNSCGLFDLCPMIKYRIRGRDAEAYLHRLTLRDVSKLAENRVQYTAWCDDRGKVLDDGTLFRYGASDFMLCCQERHLPWLLDSAIGIDVEIVDVSDEIAAVALQGPTSFAVLKAAGFDDAVRLRPFDFMTVPLDGDGDLTISRTGFTGDLGYELWMPSHAALAIWDRLWQGGDLHGLWPIGTAALDLARIEAGFIATNADFIAAEQAVRPDRQRSPFEIGLGWMVNFTKGPFNGRRVLMEEKNKNLSKWCLVGLDIEGNEPAQQSLVYYQGREEVGRITAAIWSPSAKRNIALASLRRPYGEVRRDNLWVEIYAQHELEWHRLMMRARVTERPFYNPPRRTQTPPPLC